MKPKLNATPSANAASDNTKRTPTGKFAKGNFGGPGNPFAQKTAFLCTIAMETATEKEVREIFEALREKTKRVFR